MIQKWFKAPEIDYIQSTGGDSVRKVIQNWFKTDQGNDGVLWVDGVLWDLGVEWNEGVLWDADVLENVGEAPRKGPMCFKIQKDI